MWAWRHWWTAGKGPAAAVAGSAAAAGPALAAAGAAAALLERWPGQASAALQGGGRRELPAGGALWRRGRHACLSMSYAGESAAALGQKLSNKSLSVPPAGLRCVHPAAPPASCHSPPAAPEVFTGGKISEKSDVFALVGGWWVGGRLSAAGGWAGRVGEAGGQVRSLSPVL